jgi:transposase
MLARPAQLPMSDLFSPAGQQLLATARLAVESRSRVDSLLRLIAALDFEIDTFNRLVAGRLRTDPGYRAIQQLPGVGPVLAAVFVAEIGDITRFGRPQQLASWAGLTAGLTPTHHESDTTVHRGRITDKTRPHAWCAGRSRPCNAPPHAPASVRSATRWAAAAAATSESSPPPGSSPNWCSMACATTTSAACPPRRPRREQPGPAGGRGSCKVMIPEPARRDRPI